VDVVFILLLLGFVAAQGAAVFATAYFMLRVLRSANWLAKFAAMTLSYFAWIAFTVWGYFVTGGDGSFMKGFSLVLMLCCTALASSLAYLLLWLVWPVLRKAKRSAIAA
jgi:hypothetical protein